MTSPEPPAGQRPLRNPDVVLKRLGTDAVLYHPGRRSVHVLNATAQAVWELCDGDHSSSQIEAAMRTRFRLPDGSDLESDLERTLEELLRCDLVRWGPARES